MLCTIKSRENPFLQNCHKNIHTVIINVKSITFQTPLSIFKLSLI